MAETLDQKYAASGHPSIEELKQAPGAGPTSDRRQLLGDFWPEDEDIDDFLAAVRDWRGHNETGSTK